MIRAIGTSEDKPDLTDDQRAMLGLLDSTRAAILEGGVRAVLVAYTHDPSPGLAGSTCVGWHFREGVADLELIGLLSKASIMMCQVEE